MIDYRSKAIDCVKNTALSVMRAQFEECGRSLDAQYEKYGDTEFFHGETIEPGHVYEVGYPQCFCPDVQRGEVNDASQCECSRQSILYVLQELLPESKIQVQTLHTVLDGSKNCRFRVTVD